MTPPLFAGIQYPGAKARRRNSRGMSGHHSSASATEDWGTPPYIIEALGGAGSFDLDPASMENPPSATARRCYTIRDNGLLLPWFGRVWLNPPYGVSLLTAFLGRLAYHGRGTALIFARTETDAFRRHVWEAATGLLFLYGRLNFHFPDGTRASFNAGAPSVLCAYGMRDADILAGAVGTTVMGEKIEGAFVPLLIPRSVLVEALDATWAQALAQWFARQRGPVRLSDLYGAFAEHRKAQANPNYRAKIRQQLQRGPYRRVARGEWQLAEAEA
jgi:hypothetical protein